MTATITLDLPPDAVVSYAKDQQGYVTNDLELTINKTDVPFFVRFLLDGIPQAEKDQLPLERKEAVAQAAGLKYVYRLPSIVRTLMIGTAIGIAIKTFSDNLETRKALALALKSTGEAIGFVIPVPTLLEKAVSVIATHPYITSATLGAVSLATTQAPNEMASAVSYVMEGSLSLAKKTMSALASGARGYMNFCRNHPKTGAVITTSIPLGIAAWLKASEIHKLQDTVMNSISAFFKK